MKTVGDWFFAALVAIALPGLLSAAMPVAEQNGLVKKYCAVCHMDAAKSGGLSLEHYNAGLPDPGLAAMILSKLNNGAMGAAGMGVPDQAAQKAWLDSTVAQAVGATEWHVSRESGRVSAGIVKEVAPRRTGSKVLPLYRLQFACDASGKGEVQLTWSPEAQTSRTITVVIDGKQTLEYKIEGNESMGNGQSGAYGHASVMLSEGQKLRLPSRSLIVRELFAGETVEFAFDGLESDTGRELQRCFLPSNLSGSKVGGW